MRNIHHHFSNIASRYRHLRTTDTEPILCIKRTLGGFRRIIGADIGCGAGRYDLALFRTLGSNLHLICLDCSREMLRQLKEHLSRHRIWNFRTLESPAENLPLEDRSLDCVFTFNAIHHFDFARFLEEASRVLREHGYLFIYTRLRSQNRRNIWGRYFPMFNEKETRLRELDELQESLEATPQMKLQSVEFFKYRRVGTLKSLVNRARNGHYSTFHLYSDGELKEALNQFRENLRGEFRDLNNISWFDENVLLVLEKEAAPKPLSRLHWVSTPQLRLNS